MNHLNTTFPEHDKAYRAIMAKLGKKAQGLVAPPDSQGNEADGQTSMLRYTKRRPGPDWLDELIRLIIMAHLPISVSA